MSAPLLTLYVCRGFAFLCLSRRLRTHRPKCPFRIGGIVFAARCQPATTLLSTVFRIRLLRHTPSAPPPPNSKRIWSGFPVFAASSEDYKASASAALALARLPLTPSVIAKRFSSLREFPLRRS